VPRNTRDQDRAAYERHKAAARAHAARSYQEGRDIGPIPKPANPARRKRCARNFRKYCETYHADEFPMAWSPDHMRVIKQIERAVLHGGTFAVAMPRGSGKSTLAIVATEWSALYGHHQFVIFIGSSEDAAAEMLDAFKVSVEGNDMLAADFPEVCIPIRALEGIANRASGQTCEGERTHIGWKTKEVILPKIKRSKASSAVVRVAGLTGRIRGQRVTRPDGTTVRPSLVIIDDPQTDESAKSVTQSETRERILAGAVLGLAGPGRKISGIMPCTVISRGDMADRILDRVLHPEWNGERTRMVYEWPADTEAWNEYADRYRSSLREHGDIRDATEYYRANQKKMDRGAVVGWEDRFNHDEISAIQNAYNLWLRDAKAFAAEYQNEPVDETEDEDAPMVLTRAGLVARSSACGYEIADSERWEDGDSLHTAGAAPASLEYCTVACDVQRGGQRAPGRLYYLVDGWDTDGGGWLLGWGSIRLCPIGQQPSVVELHAGLSRLDQIIATAEWSAPVVGRVVDVGDRMTDIVPWVRRTRGWYAVRGDSRAHKAQVGDIQGVIYRRRQEAGWNLYLVQRDAVRQQVHGALSIPPQEPGAYRVPYGLTTTDAIVRHLVGTLQINDGKSGLRWSDRASDRKWHPEWQRRIDYLDCAVYGRAFAVWWRAQQRRARKKPRRSYGVTSRGKT